VWIDDTVDQHFGSAMWYLCFKKREFSKNQNMCMAHDQDELVKNVAALGSIKTG
jgi:hypothetical protein